MHITHHFLSFHSIFNTTACTKRITFCHFIQYPTQQRVQNASLFAISFNIQHNSVYKTHHFLSFHSISNTTACTKRITFCHFIQYPTQQRVQNASLFVISFNIQHNSVYKTHHFLSFHSISNTTACTKRITFCHFIQYPTQQRVQNASLFVISFNIQHNSVYKTHHFLSFYLISNTTACTKRITFCHFIQYPTQQRVQNASLFVISFNIQHNSVYKTHHFLSFHSISNTTACTKRITFCHFIQYPTQQRVQNASLFVISFNLQHIRVCITHQFANSS